MTPRFSGLLSAASVAAVMVAVTTIGASPPPEAPLPRPATGAARGPAIAPAPLTAGAVDPATVVPVTVAYGTDKAQTFDWYDDPGLANAPWVVTIHGGSWAAGSKANADPISRMFLAAGFQVFDVEYRKSTDYAAAVGAPWPAQRTDVLSAVAYIKAHAASYRINPNRGALYGFSAGGHIAVSAALYNGAGASPMKAVVSASGVLQPHRVQDVADSDPAVGWAGDLPTAANRTLARWEAVLFRCPRLTDWTDCNNRWNDGLPEKHASAGDPPVYMIMGDADPSVPPKTLSAFQYWLNLATVPNVAVMVPGGTHNEALLTGNATQWNAMLAWLRQKTA